MASWWLLGLAALGAVNALYFTLAYYGRIQSHAVPAVLCRREERTCFSIVHTPYASLFGPPNALLALGYYALTAAVAVQALAGTLPQWLWLATFLAGMVPVLLAPYLTWALVARLRTWCWL